MKTLCVSGHRPDGLPWFKNGYNQKLHGEFTLILEEYLKFAIQNGFTHFIAGGALGVDTDFALLVLKLKRHGEKITLEIAVPCKGQEKYWNTEDKAVYNYILQHADKVTYLSETYYSFCMQRRNEYMVENSDALLVCWNGIKKGGTYSTAKHAIRQGKLLLHVDLREDAPNGANSLIYFKNRLV